MVIIILHNKKIEAGYLDHVIEVFDRLGYQITYNGSDGDWDVLWSHEYPFMKNFLPHLKPYQRVSLFNSILIKLLVILSLKLILVN